MNWTLLIRIFSSLFVLYYLIQAGVLIINWKTMKFSEKIFLDEGKYKIFTFKTFLKAGAFLIILYCTI